MFLHLPHIGSTLVIVSQLVLISDNPDQSIETVWFWNLRRMKILNSAIAHIANKSYACRKEESLSIDSLDCVEIECTYREIWKGGAAPFWQWDTHQYWEQLAGHSYSCKAPSLMVYGINNDDSSAVVCRNFGSLLPCSSPRVMRHLFTSSPLSPVSPKTSSFSILLLTPLGLHKRSALAPYNDIQLLDIYNFSPPLICHVIVWLFFVCLYFPIFMLFGWLITGQTVTHGPSLQFPPALP